MGFGPPISNIVVPGAITYAFPQGPTKATSKAAFGQITYDLMPDLHLTGGIRHTQDKKWRDGATVVDFSSVATSLYGQLRCVLNQNVAARAFSKTTWRVGLDYDAPGLGLIYASVPTGYKAGGFNDGCVVGTGPGCELTPDTLYYSPEILTAYEAGFKFRISPEFNLNGAVFHYDYEDLQISQVVTVPVPATLTSNAASAKVDGIEHEALIRPSDNDRFDIIATYTHARYGDFDADVSGFPGVSSYSFSGRLLDHAPKYTVMAVYTHTFPLANGARIELGARTRFSSEYFVIDLNNLSQFRQPSFTKTDLNATYTAVDDRFFVQAFVKNLENEITLAAASSGLIATAAIEAPRTYGVRAGVKF